MADKEQPGKVTEMETEINCRFSGYPEGAPALYRIMRRKWYLRITGALLWMAGWVAACAAWGKNSAYMTPGAWVGLGVVIGVCGWRVFRLGGLLRDRPFEGTIVSLRLAHVMHSDTPWLGKGMRKEPQVTAVIDVCGEDGAIPIYFRFPVKDIHPKDYYAVGDRVRHYRGLPYLEKESKSEDVCICVACGKYSYMQDERCEFCHKPLLK